MGGNGASVPRPSVLDDEIVIVYKLTVLMVAHVFEHTETHQIV